MFMHSNLIDPNYTQKLSNAFFWAMEFIKKGVSVIILPLDISLCPEISCFLNTFLYFLLVGHLFRGSKRVKSCPIWFHFSFQSLFISLIVVVMVERGRKDYNTTVEGRRKLVYRKMSKMVYRNNTCLLMSHSKMLLQNQILTGIPSYSTSTQGPDNLNLD